MIGHASSHPRTNRTRLVPPPARRAALVTATSPISPRGLKDPSRIWQWGGRKGGEGGRMLVKSLCNTSSSCDAQRAPSCRGRSCWRRQCTGCPCGTPAARRAAVSDGAPCVISVLSPCIVSAFSLLHECTVGTWVGATVGGGGLSPPTFPNLDFSPDASPHAGGSAGGGAGRGGGCPPAALATTWTSSCM